MLPANKETSQALNQKPPPSVQLHLGDPQVEPLASAEFDAIPRYLRGRLTLERINSFVAAINKVFMDKYAIVRSNPARIPPDQRTRYYQWREEELEELAGRFFVTENDLKSSKTPVKLDPANRSILSILRHVSRLKELRTGSILRLVLN